MSEFSKQRNKGGRPKKEFPRDQQLAVLCTLTERNLIARAASSRELSVSEYLRDLAIHGQVDKKAKVLPKEVLSFTTMLNHLAANINQIAKKRNRDEIFNALERAEWISLSMEVKKLAEEIKNYLK